MSIIIEKGSIVELLQMDDVQAPKTGTLGVVQYVDDTGSVHVRWDSGSGLAILPDQDEFNVLTGPEGFNEESLLKYAQRAYLLNWMNSCGLKMENLAFILNNIVGGNSNDRHSLDSYLESEGIDISAYKLLISPEKFKDVKYHDREFMEKILGSSSTAFKAWEKLEGGKR